MSKPIIVERSEILDDDPSCGRVKLADGRTVAQSRIRIIAEAAIEPGFIGVPYSGTESAADRPAAVTVPTGDWIDRPA